MKYRKEIDGLRAIAVLSVIFFHADIGIFPGGFVGVDIFFVISGYLITTIIVDDLNKNIFSIINFYERRARRILPALFFVLLVSLPLAWVFLLPSDLNNFSESMIYVSVFSSNLFFYKSSGYFDKAAELKPLLHMWSLAVEEQFYLIFPLIITFLWRFGSRFVLISLLFFLTISFIYADLMSVKNPSLAFYLLQARGWELLIGSVIAIHLECFQHGKRHPREIPSVIGLIFIGAAVFYLDKNLPYPSSYTLIPTIGAALIILFSSAKGVVGGILSSKVLVKIGLISYSLYLWHQPFFVFARHYFLEEPTLPWKCSLVISTFMMAYLSWKFVEQPFRNKKYINTNVIFIFSVTGICFFAVIGEFNKSKQII